MPILSRKQHAVVVDAYSGGRTLIPAYQSLGYPVVHVQSMPEPPSYFHAANERARAGAEVHLVHTGDVEATARAVRRADPCLVVPGSEGGVLLADALAERLDLPFRNPIASSTARRDKFLMHERLRAAGLSGICQATVSDVAGLDTWLASHGRYPVVVKPLSSAGTQGVSVCHSRAQAVAAGQALLGTTDIFGSRNDLVLCQEFLAGEEYVLNGVACGGHYRFTEGWRSDKRDNAGYRVYDTQYLFWHGDPEFDELCRYVVQVCQALDLLNGAFHAEIMLTPSGPVLIEIAARLAGGADPYYIEACLGHSQIGHLVHASLHPARYLATPPAPPVAPAARAAYVYLVADTPGSVHHLALDGFLEVEGVVSVDYHYQPGDRQELTRDLLTSPGVVTVVAGSAAALNETVRRVREVERTMYAATIEPWPGHADTTRPVVAGR